MSVAEIQTQRGRPRKTHELLGLAPAAVRSDVGAAIEVFVVVLPQMPLLV